MGFWSNKRVTVTGGGGFLGSFLLERLRALGCKEIFAPRSRDYDLVQMEAVQRLYRDTQPDILVHLAAQVGGIGANQAQPGKFFYDNLLMGAQLMEVGRQVSVEKFVALGTICAYPKHTPVPFRETDLWNGYPEETNAPYGLAKKMLLVQSQAYRQQYDFSSIVLFPVNLYGPRDNFDLKTSHVIPALISKCLEAMAAGASHIEVWGDGSPTREFLFVEDAAKAICLATELYNSSEPVNLGSGEEISIKDLVRAVMRLTGYSGDVRWNTSKPNGQPRRRLDTSKAERLFGFKATVTLEEGLRRTVEWFRATRGLA